MFPPVLLVDNDALLKAAHWDLLDVVPALLGCTWQRTACLSQFPPRVARAEAKLFANPDVARALSARLAQCCLLRTAIHAHQFRSAVNSCFDSS